MTKSEAIAPHPCHVKFRETYTESATPPHLIVNKGNGKQRRRSSLSQLTTIEDIVSQMSNMGDDIDESDDAGYQLAVFQKTKCFKCSRRFEIIEQSVSHDSGSTRTRRRSSSSSILYSDLLLRSNTNGKVEVPFDLMISASPSFGGSKKINIPFVANFMNEVNSDNDSNINRNLTKSPYFADINLNDYFISKDPKREPTGYKRKFPGYEIPRKGQLQLVINNNENTTTSIIIIPYNLKGLSKNCKKIIKVRNSKIITYKSDNESSEPQQIQIKRVTNEIEFKALNYSNKRFYLFDTIKLLFTPSSQKSNLMLPLSASVPNTEGFHFNPKFPIYPSDCKSHQETIDSDEFPVDLKHYVYKCRYCDYFGDDQCNTSEDYADAIVDDDDETPKTNTLINSRSYSNDTPPKLDATEQDTCPKNCCDVDSNNYKVKLCNPPKMKEATRRRSKDGQRNTQEKKDFMYATFQLS
ncbi:hypothetical protein CANARDRAFT_7844 [[Candida] arabinofermentans NRRL YB-2248]|uniref:DUF4210 domain-containing protein n=1 Tax=[Candida] arabinofermentans NRRL YB-2248 TaxID=983967 RepID=A0A1E4T0A0_9ASCO|nr:hypothetical protein CANARDRAFT_7844 [[Candida] arabinofermentans NRRL YB-2248]